MGLAIMIGIKQFYSFKTYPTLMYLLMLFFSSTKEIVIQDVLRVRKSGCH